jgi:hypothetical protein
LLLLQGFSTAFLEVCGIETVLRLWDGISNSPVLAVYSGYGIGSCIGVVLMMKYVKFNPKDSYFDTLNFTNTSINRTLIADDIKLQMPFTIGGVFGVFVVIGFIIINLMRREKNMKLFDKKNTDVNSYLLQEQKTNSANRKQSKLESFDKILFNSKFTSRKGFFIKMNQLVLLTLLSITLVAYVSINSSYLLPYTTMGRLYFLYFLLLILI